MGTAFSTTLELQLWKIENVRSLTREELSRRTGIFVRWTQWLVQQQKSKGPCVVVNLDETSISGLKHNQHGTIISGNSQKKSANPERSSHAQCHESRFDGLRVQ